MKNSKKFLNFLLKTSQTGQISIRSVLDAPIDADLRTALHAQLREYSSIENEAYGIACQRGWELADVDLTIKFLTDRIARFRLNGRDPGSKIADMLILFNTKGMIKGLRILNNFTEPDPRVSILCRKLLDCENACIRQMQEYL